jgi:hypothetical protein
LLFLPAAGFRNSNGNQGNNTGSYGYYWSSTISAAVSHILNFYNTYVNPKYYNSRAGGFSVRCVAEGN